MHECNSCYLPFDLLKLLLVFLLLLEAERLALDGFFVSFLVVSWVRWCDRASSLPEKECGVCVRNVVKYWNVQTSALF